MATIHRHPIPPSSFAPDKPLNDLLVAQMQHFQHIEKRLPRRIQPSLQSEHAPPSPQDSASSSRYIAAMTNLIRQRAVKQPSQNEPSQTSPQLVPKPSRPRRPIGIPTAPSATETTPPAPPKQNKTATPRVSKRRKP